MRETKRRIKDIQAGRTYEHYGSAVNNKKPETFALSKKLAEHRRPNQYVITEHVKNLASLQRRLQNLNDISMRRKNNNDPISYPAMFRKNGSVPKPDALSGMRKKLIK